MKEDDWKAIGRRVIALCAKEKRMVLAVSGGVDSMVLMHLVARCVPKDCRQDYLVATVHHGLSPNAQNWCDFVEKESKKLCFSFSCSYVTCVKEGNGIEDAARKARYAALCTQARQHQARVILLAHHADDRLETFALAWMRGQVEGLCGQRYARRMNGVQIVRPLNHITRAQIRAFAQYEHIAYIHDESNDDIRYARNYVRHEVLPVMKNWRQGTDQSMLKTIAGLEMRFDVLDTLLRERIQKEVQEGIFDWRNRRTSPQVRALRFRMWLSCYQIYWRQTRWLDRSRQLERNDNIASWWNNARGAFLRVYQGKVYYDDGKRKEFSWLDSLWVDLQKTFNLQGNNRIQSSLLTVKKGLNLKEKLRLHPKAAHKTLKNLVQEKRIPPYQRTRMHMVYWQEKLLWVEGIGMNFRYIHAWDALLFRE